MVQPELDIKLLAKPKPKAAPAKLRLRCCKINCPIRSVASAASLVKGGRPPARRLCRAILRALHCILVIWRAALAVGLIGRSIQSSPKQFGSPNGMSSRCSAYLGALLYPPSPITPKATSWSVVDTPHYRLTVCEVHPSVSQHCHGPT